MVRRRDVLVPFHFLSSPEGAGEKCLPLVFLWRHQIPEQIWGPLWTLTWVGAVNRAA